MQDEKRGHDAERAPHEHRPAVAAAGADDGEGRGGDGCKQRAEGNAPEVHGAAELDLVAAHEVEERRWDARDERRERERGDEPISHLGCVSARTCARLRHRTRNTAGLAMTERIDTVVIGAGQAGLSASYHLSQAGREHVVLERGEVADSWRNRRWDGFYLNTPKFTQQLPGFEYDGPEPEAFSSRDETISYLDDYAGSFSAPVRAGVEVVALRREDGGLQVEAAGETLRARNVVVATGAYQSPTPNTLAQQLPDDVFQLQTDDYRRPEQLPDGAVLVVGGGQSGCQIADELRLAGRTVYLSVGRCPWLPRRYRGREIVHWLVESGYLDQTVDTLPSPAARLLCNPPISGNDGGHDCHPRWLEARGVTLLGRLVDVHGHTLTLASDLEESLAFGEELRARVLARDRGSHRR